MAGDKNKTGSLFSGAANALADATRDLVAANTAAGAKYTEYLNAPHRFKINGSDYYCYFEISNSESPEDHIHPTKIDPTNKIRLTKSAIVNLDIQENLFEPFCSGSITINNPFDYIEDNHYTTGNGDDFLHMKLCEWTEFSEGRDTTKALTYTFVITDESNSVSKTDRSNNFKTYKLLDKNYAKLNEEIPYNTTYPTNAMKEVGDISVGACIKQVLIDVLGEEVINTDLWNNGAHNIGEPNGSFAPIQEHITIPITWKYSDLLKYLLKINYALGGESGSLPVQCILYFDRSIQKYSLEPADALFKDNNALVIEAFGLGDLTGNIDQQQSQGNRVGTNKNNPIDSSVPVNIYEGMLNNLNVTTPMVSYGDEFFVNYSAGSFDQQAGNFGKGVISLQSLVPEWEKSFVKVFKLVGGFPRAFIPFNPTRARTVKTMLFPFPKDHVVNIAKAQMVSNLTFLNLQLTIDNQGNTNRRPGKFIDIFKLKGEESDTSSSALSSLSLADGKTLGRWFVTKVHHRFFKDSYENVIQCVKTYVGPDNPPSSIPVAVATPSRAAMMAGTVATPESSSVASVGSSRRASGQYRATAYGNVLGDDGAPLDNTTRDDIAKGDMKQSWQYLGNRNNRLIPGYSVASNNFPHGTLLRINGKEYRVDDTGGMDPNANIIDFYAGGDRQLYGRLANMPINSVEVIN